jgi:Cof subfamily protein (haloacid dehalogenase superfamily)
MKNPHPDIRLIAADLDGTLLNSEGGLSQRNTDAVGTVQDLGIAFVLVSARPPFGMQWVVERLQLGGLMIAYNGALVIDTRLENVLIDRLMSAADTQAVIRIVREHALYTSYYSGMEWFVEQDCEEVAWEARAQKRWPKITDLAAPSTPRPHKLIVADLKDRNKLETGYREIKSRLPHLNVHYSGRWSFEVCDAKATKASALAFVADHMQIHHESIMAIGDNYNDLDMLDFAGLSVAVSNAPDEVRSAADWVAAANDEDGVAFAIERLLSVKSFV